MIISLDTETTGLDHKHGARPYLVTICSSVTRQPRYWQWEVNPLTREVIPNSNDLKEIQQYINSADEVVLQNSKFDVHMLDTVIPNLNWDWSKTHDIWAGAHVLDSSQPKDLTALSLRYISVNILPLETRINDTAKECRTIASKYFKKWKLCEIGDEDMPSVKRTPYKADMWLPRALAKARNYPKEHPYWSVTADYANTDSEVTLAIWLGHTHANGLHEKGMKAELEEKGLWNHYKFRLESMRLAYKMECKGMSIDPKKTIHILYKYEKQSEQFGKECTTMAARYGTELELPKKGVNDSLRHCIWNVMGLEKRKNKKGVISLDKDVMEWYDHALTPDSNEHKFIKALRNKADVDASISYLKEYQRFWVQSQLSPEFKRLYPNYNPYATKTLRWSSSNPNCFDGETELLTTNGWIKAHSLQSHHIVAQYHSKTGEIDFTDALLIKQHYKGKMHHITSDTQIDMMLTSEHRCLLENRKTHKKFVVRAKDFKEDHKHLHAGLYSGGTRHLTDNEIIWICAVQADGHYQKTNGAKHGIRFVFVKERKATQLKKCLDEMGTKYTYNLSEGQYYFYIKSDTPATRLAKELLPNKQFGSWVLSITRSNIDRMLEEIFFWDGDWTKKCLYSSSDKDNVDWIQALLALSNKRGYLLSQMPKNSWAKRIHHYLNITQRNYSLTTNFTEKLIDWDDYVYCVTVPSSFIVIRRNGKVSITGNSQNIGKDEDDSGYSLRSCFAPEPGRELWSFDAKNVELRIPGYKSKQKEMIALFEESDAPPFFGSNHMLVFSILWPELWEKALKEYGPEKAAEFCKKTFKASNYGWTKNFNFCVQYGGGKEKADLTAHLIGAFDLVNSKFDKLSDLNKECIAFANKHGYIETIPDRTVDPNKGYPLVCERVWGNQIKPTLPLNYQTQGSAMWLTNKVQIAVDALLEDWNKEGFDAFIATQVHDEIVVDMPKRCDPRDTRFRHKSNLGRARIIQQLAERQADDWVIHIPVLFGCDFHPDDWSKAVSF